MLLTFSQDSVQRAAGKHTVYFYDQHNRLAMQGEVTQDELPDVSRMTVRCIRKNHASYYTNTSMQLGVLMYEFEGTDYYVNLNVLSDVPEVHPTFHLINYYDDYDFLETTALASFTFPEGNGYGQGRLTGTIVNTYDENGIITQGTSFEPIAPLALVPITSPRVDRSSNVVTVHYYDIKGREVQKVENNLKGGYETTTTGYTFTGQPGTVTHTHTDGTNSLTETYTYSYDGRDRVDSVKHTLNNGTEVSMTVNAYDNHGRLLTTTHNGKDSLKTTYAYNIRDWMTGLDNTLYSHTLTYGYGGNIATRQWTQDSKTRKYTYTYDGLDRLTGAAYTGDGNYATNYAYDKNGNIKTLQRYDVSLVDNLTLTYSGNRLTKVEDASNNTFGFANGASTTNEYTYDGNGNLTKDSNKGITNISYNSLSLPSVVTFGNGNTITYLYTADGRKLRTVHVINGTATTTDYCGNVIYENGTRKLLLTEAGYVDLTDNSYHYYIKDHLGNNRVVADANGTVEESNQYYPFGLMYANANSNIQPYKYNGKELDTKNGLNWYDYGARHYDAALGRWHAVDPLTEKYYSTSPYAYCLNNPVKYIDLLGCDTIPANEIWDYDLVNTRTNGMGIMNDHYIPVSIDGKVKYHLHQITTGENKGSYLAIEQLGSDENGIEMYEYKYVIGKDKVNSFINGENKPTGIQYNMLRFAKDNGVDFGKDVWENMFKGYARILTDPMNWLPNPLDPVNIVPKSYYTINPWNRFLMLNRGKYTKENYGTYKNALQQRSLDYKKWKY